MFTIICLNINDMKKKVVLLFICSILLISCKSNEFARGSQVLFESSKDICGLNVKYVHLHVPQNIFIGPIDEVLNDNKHIYLFSCESDNSAIYVFNRITGEYIKSIGRFGRGPEEYLYPSSITLNDDVLSIVDEGQNIVLNYDANTLEFIDRKITPNIGGFAVNDNIILANIYELGGEYPRNAFASLDKKFEIISEQIPKPIVSGYVIGPSKPLYSYGNSIRAYTQLVPYVYEFDGRNSHIIYNLNFDGLKFPEKAYLKRISTGDKDYTIPLFESEYISYFDVFETTNNILSMCIANDKRYLGIYNKSTNQGYLLSGNDLLKVSPALPFMVSGVMDDMFVIPMSVTDLAVSIPSKELQEFLNKASDTDIILQLIAVK